jgi:hypothetical protein
MFAQYLPQQAAGLRVVDLLETLAELTYCREECMAWGQSYVFAKMEIEPERCFI